METHEEHLRRQLALQDALIQEQAKKLWDIREAWKSETNFGWVDAPALVETLIRIFEGGEGHVQYD